ncbi:ADP-ribosylglycohydrolase family protein [Paenibacillus sp. WQ 127069]|uniref:ADP-ribosylglycohydrolase family protein n=1 Tax=Paenibacillus baimaensis TaxID=2982185 RepID=A0ABT2UUC2_9BACL|nr:ADP-ribosylglycohydrolase family protein [Paenibacillus sp. WQ 127069]MCU6798225.1 ADP-ribosylglycohydrolase family protein [Paenibacillus sp. WQ 127069]
MTISILNEQDYYRIVYGGWLGKNIGGTLGAPVEGVKELLNLDFYPELPDGPLENDDLDLQLVWLHALEQYGPSLTNKELGQEWIDHIFFPFDEYGYALTNLRRGLIAPVAGWFNNPFNNCMGSPIRSEIWAMVAPGAPETAARYAYEDATVDHAGGEGVYGEMLFASIESAIFFEQDRDRLIEIGLRYIPADCRTALAVKDLLRWHQEGKDWIEARALILDHHGRENFTDAPQNIAFTILGWLYGKDFEDAILKATNCGYDTDCTAATLGAILGMILGPEGLPAKWVQPVGDRVVISPPIKGFPAPQNLDELTRRTIAVGKQVLAAWHTGIIVHPELPTTLQDRVEERDSIEAMWNRPVTENRYLLPKGTSSQPNLELVLNYGDEGPAIGIDQSKNLTITVTNRSLVLLEGSLSLEVPAGWSGPAAEVTRLNPGESTSWKVVVKSSSQSESSYRLALNWTRYHDGHVWSEERIPFALVGAAHWTIWGPTKAENGIEVVCAGNKINWQAVSEGNLIGTYRARTNLYNPSTRKLRLIAAANAPISVKLNGETVIDCQKIVEFMPAYHRPATEQLYEVTLAAGTHVVEVEVTGQGEDLEVYVLPVATLDTTSPGKYYYYTDMMFVK